MRRRLPPATRSPRPGRTTTSPHLEAVWWPQEEEGGDSVLSRARLFRGEMRERPDWPHTVVVCHWGFILAMTGQSVMNGQWLRVDPTEEGPLTVSWQHG